jgi:hypothetical protein
MREIALTQGKVALVDDEDFELVSQWKWCVLRGKYTWYAVRGCADGKSVLLHREILGLSAGMGDYVDHKDGDGLNNQRSNLRIATQSQNNANARNRLNVSSPYKGVCWDKARNVWMARISEIFLGRFSSEEDAARAYDEAAVERFGEYARTNF